MIKIVRRILNTLTYPLSLSEQKMKEEYENKDLAMIGVMSYGVLCGISFLFKGNLIDPESVLGSCLLALGFLAAVGVCHVLLEFVGNFRRSKVRNK